MKKCDCYHIQTRRKYTYNPITGDPIGHDVDTGVCWGTKEIDVCSCGGNMLKCDFYPEVRKKARKEQKPTFGKWTSVKDRLPKKDGKYLCFCDSLLKGQPRYVQIYEFALNLMTVDKYDFDGQKHEGWYSYDSEWGYCEHTNITHWQPLPKPPKGE